MSRREAVILCIFDCEQELVLMQRRIGGVRDGDLLFPGEKREPGDTTILETARRGMYEELKVDKEGYTVKQIQDNIVLQSRPDLEFTLMYIGLTSEVLLPEDDGEGNLFEWVAMHALGESHVEEFIIQMVLDYLGNLGDGV